MVQTGFLSHCRAPLLLRSRAPLPRRPRRRGPGAADPQAAQAAAAHDPAGGTHRCRVLAVSDLHVDYPENLEWCRGISSTEHRCAKAPGGRAAIVQSFLGGRARWGCARVAGPGR